MSLREGQIINDRRILGFPVDGNPVNDGDVLTWNETKLQFEFKPNALPILQHELKKMNVTQNIPIGATADLNNMEFTLPDNNRRSLVYASILMEQLVNGVVLLELRKSDDTPIATTQKWTTANLNQLTFLLFDIRDNDGSTVKLTGTSQSGGAVVFIKSFSRFEFQELL